MAGNRGDGGAAGPFPGLSAFEEGDAARFFGRQKEIELLSLNLRATRWTVVYGAAGVGKSSLLRAGVQGHLRDRARERSIATGVPGWVVAEFHAWPPGQEPLMPLLAAVRDAVVNSHFPATSVELPGEYEHVVDLKQRLGALAEEAGCRLLIILDQFEDYLIYHDETDAPGTVMGELARVLGSPDLRVNILVSVREDALARLDRFSGRMGGVFKNLIRIEPLDRESAREAILGPVDWWNGSLPEGEEPVTIAPALVEALLSQLPAARGILGHGGRGETGEAARRGWIEPVLMQLVLTRIWETRGDSRQLKPERLEDLNGVEGILRTHLDVVLADLSEPEQAMAARLFDRLVTPTGYKVAMGFADLVSYLETSAEELDPLLTRLMAGEKRVLRVAEGFGDADNAPTPGLFRRAFELFHDALAPAVLRWRAEYLRVQQSAQELEEARQCEEAARREANEQRRLARLWRTRLYAVVLAVVAIALLLVVTRQLKAANDQAIALRLGAAATGLIVDPELGVLLAAEAARMAPMPETENVLRDALFRHRERRRFDHGSDRENVVSVLFYPGDRIILSAGEDTIRVWDRSQDSPLRTLSLRAAGGDERFEEWAFEAGSGRLHLLTTREGRLNQRAWDPAQVDAPGGIEVAGLPAGVLLATRSHDHRYLAFTSRASEVHAIEVWDLESGQRNACLGCGVPIPDAAGHTNEIEDIVFSPNDRFLLSTGADRQVLGWDWRTGQLVRRFRGHDDSVVAAAFSPTGDRVITASWDRTARIWDWDRGEALVTLRGHNGGLGSVAFSPDGRFVVTAGGQDPSAIVWEAGTGARIRDLIGHTNAVYDARFNAAGTQIVTAGGDGTVRVWDPGIGQTQLTGSQSITSLRTSPGNTNIVVADGGGKVRWRRWTDEWQEIPRGTNPVLAATLSPNSETLLTVSEEGLTRRVEAFAISDGRLLASRVGVSSKVLAVANLRGADFAAFTVESNTVLVSRTNTGEVAARLEGFSNEVAALVFDSKGIHLAGGDSDGLGLIWSTADWKRPPKSVGGFHAEIRTLAFSREGEHLVTTGDNRVGVWETGTGRLLATLSEPHHHRIASAEFDPFGSKLVTAGLDGLAVVWDWRGERVLAVLRGHEGPLVQARFSPNGVFVATAGEDGTARIWDALTGHELFLLPSHSQPLIGLVWSPDGRRLLTGGTEGLVQEHEIEECGSLGHLLDLAHARVPRTLTPTERSLFLRGDRE